MRLPEAIVCCVALGACASVELACRRAEPLGRSQTLEVGHHRLQLVVPSGWEHLDHGRQQLFRLDECQLSLKDMGVANRDGLVRDLRKAEALWQAGRRDDACARVRDLRGPMFVYARRGQVGDFWSPWTNATYPGGTTHRAAIGAAFEVLIDNTADFDAVTPAQLLDYVLASTRDMRRAEIATQSSRPIHDADWTDVETWDRVSHLSRSRLAYTQRGGYLLVLSMDRGLHEQADAAFEALLSSIQLAPPDSTLR